MDLSGLARGLSQVGVGYSGGLLAGQNTKIKLQQQRAMMDYRNAMLGVKPQLAKLRIDEQQRLAAGRTADTIAKMLQDPAQQDNFAKMPGLRQQLIEELNNHRAVFNGQMDWRDIPQSKFVDPLTGNPLTKPGETPPWQPGVGQTEADNPLLTTKGRQSQQRIGIATAAQQSTDTFHKGLIAHFGLQDIIAGTRENADLAQKQFEDTLQLEGAKINAGHMGFQEQAEVWGKLLTAAQISARAGGNPGAALKPFLFQHMMGGSQILNPKVATDYLRQSGATEDEIGRVLGDFGSGGGGAQFSGAPSGASPPSGGPGGTASDATKAGLAGPVSSGAYASATGGQPDAAVKGMVQTMGGPPVLPPTFLPGGGPPTGAQVASAGGSNAGGQPGGVQPARQPGAAAPGVRPTLAGLANPPPLKNPYPQGSFEHEVFSHYTGDKGQRAVPAKFIMDQFRNNPDLMQKASNVIGTANTMQKQGRFSGAPVQDTLGATLPDNAPNFTGMNIKMPGVGSISGIPTSPVVLQGGFQGSFPVTPLAPPASGASLGAGLGGIQPPPAPPWQPGPSSSNSGGGGMIGGPFIGSDSGGGGSIEGPQIDLGPWTQGPLIGRGADQSPVREPGYYVKAPTRGPGSTLGAPSRVPYDLPRLSSGPGPSMPMPPDPFATGSTGPSASVKSAPVGKSSMGAPSRVPYDLPKVSSPAGSDWQPKGTADKTAAANIQSDLRKFRGLPFSSPIEKVFKENGITDPARQSQIYRWTTSELLPGLRKQHPEIGEKGVRALLYPTLSQRFGAKTSLSSSGGGGNVQQPGG